MKAKRFYSFTNNSKPIINNNSRYKTQRFHGRFLEIIEIFERTFFIKNNYWNLKLSIVALSSVT